MAVPLAYTTTGTTANDFSPHGECVAYPFTASSSGTLHTLVFQTNLANPAQAGLRLLVFSDNSGKPGSLLSKSAYITGASAEGTGKIIAELESTVSITSGTKYW